MFLEILWKHTSLKALKFTILLAVLQLLVSYVSSSYVSEIFTEVTIEKVKKALIAIAVKQVLHHILDLILFFPSTMEGMVIAKKITKEISEALLGANNPMSLVITNSVINEACVDSFHAYFHTIWQIVKMLPEFVDYLVVLYVSSGKSWIIIQVIGFGSMLLLLLLKTQEEALADISQRMIEITKETRKHISRLWTNYFAWKSTCYSEPPPNPALSIYKYMEQWFPKDVMVKRSHLLTDTTQEVLYLTFLFLFDEITILIWLVMNHQRLWRGIKLWIRIKEIVMHNDTKMNRHLDIYQKALVSQKKARSYIRKHWKRRKIVVKRITVVQEKCPQVVISSPVFIGPKHHALIIEGSKGSGKSYLMAILTGCVDVVANMLFGKTRIEPSQIPFFVVSQDVASHYTQNLCKTITHSANQLFRDSGKNLDTFLSKFGLEWIAENDLDAQLGENEKSLSPGTIRTIVLAHLMWELQQYLQSGKSIKFVVLDEVDTAIDFGTVRKFYTECILPLCKKYGVTCIIISHSKEFKDLVRELGGNTCRTLTATKEGNVITYQ